MTNKYQEAFGDIVDNGVSLDYFNDKSVLPQDENPLFIVQELVDKETPMKPVVLAKTIYCSKCDMRLGDNNGWTQATVGFCPSCGQKIDWGKDK